MKHNKPKVREAEITDFDKVYPLLKKMGHGQSSQEDWKNLFKNHWQLEQFSPGLLLETEEQVVGFLSTIYSQQIVDGKKQLFCNLSSWIVEEEYRSYSFLMILPLVRNKELVLTSYSSNDVSYAVYNKLGFNDFKNGTRIIYPLPSIKLLLPGAKYQIEIDPDIINSIINKDEQRLFNDHRFLLADYFLITYKNDYCLVMGNKKDNHFQFYTVTNKTFLKSHLTHFRWALIKKLGVDVLWIHEYLLNDKFIFLSRKVNWGLPYQYKTANESVTEPMPFFSELFLLNM